MNNYKHNEQSGRSMIEMLGVLAIIGVLSVGGIAGYSKAMNKFKTNKVADNVSMLVANIKTLYAQQNSYAELDNANAVSMGVVPDELGTDSSNLLNAFNGPVNIHVSGSTSSSNTNDDKAFVIYFGNLSREACITLATNDWGSGYSSGLIAIKASGTSTANTDDKSLDSTVIGCQGSANSIACPGGSQQPVPMAVTAAATACDCKSGNTCSITWKYY